MRSRFIAAGALLLLSACASTPNGQPFMGGNDNWGEANRQTLAAQIIDPMPVYTTPLEGSAVQSINALDRYKTDKVKQPDKVKTSNAEAGNK